MANLYELSAEYAAMLDAYDGADTDEDKEAIMEALTAMGENIVVKGEAYAKIIRMKQEEAKAFKAEADRLTNKRRAAENMVERLKAAILDAMKLMDVNEIPTSIGKWRVQMNPVSCEVVDIDKVPMEYHIKVVDKIDKAGLIKAYKATGELVDGVEFTQEPGIGFK